MTTTEERTRVLSVDIGIKNLSFCIVDFDNDEFDLVHVEKVAIGTMNQTSFVLTKALVDFIRSSDAINEKPIDYIFCENQLSRAVKNTVLSYALVTYFYTEASISGCNVHIQFVPPRVKFSAINAYFPGVVESQDIVCRARSKDLKKLSVSIASELFHGMDVAKGIEAMERYHPKLDDIADVFLQSFAVFLDKYRDGNKNVAGNPIGSRRKRTRYCPS